MSEAPNRSLRDRHLPGLVRETARHLAFYHVLQSATIKLGRGEGERLLTPGWCDGPALFSRLFNQHDVFPCPKAFEMEFEEAFVKGVDEARNLVGRTLR